MKAPPPSNRHLKNFQILVIARKAYFTNKDLPPSYLITIMNSIEESNRLSLAKLIVPYLWDDNDRRILTGILTNQKIPLVQPEMFKSPWIPFHDLPGYPPKGQQVDDLVQLDYAKLIDNLDVPDNAEITLFWGGLVDFLVNSWSVLQEFCLAEPLIPKMINDEEALLDSNRDQRVRRIVSWTEMQFEHHMINTIFRLRAGWDKLFDYLIAPYYGVTSLPKTWEKRLDKVNKVVSIQLDANQMCYWSNIIENAHEISRPNGLKDIRDFELHKIALRSKETLGNEQMSYSLKQLQLLSVSNHYHLQDSFVLFMALILGGKRIPML